MKKTLSIIVTLAVIGSSVSAAAQEPVGALNDQATIPAFTTLDRADGQSRLDFASSISFFDGDDPDFNNRIDVYGQHVSASGLGGYATLPFSFIAEDSDSESAMGNLEFGAIYAMQNAEVPIVWRAGLALPTASDDAGAWVNLLTVSGRLTDLSSAIPETTWLRLSASPMLRRGNGFVRVDAGLDIPIDSDELDGLTPLR